MKSTMRNTMNVALAGLLALAFGDTATAEEPSLVLSGPIQYADGSMQFSAPPANLAPVGDSGQRRCWDDFGDQVSCSGTGQDGERQAGTDWPAPRFLDNRDGTVSDKLTGLVWLRDAGCFSAHNWIDALDAANNLSDGFCSLSDGSKAGDWRLPNVRELQSLVDFGQHSPALPVGHLFVDVRLTFYWTSTSAVDSPANAWAVGVYFGGIDNGPKTGSFSLWPVRNELSDGP